MTAVQAEVEQAGEEEEPAGEVQGGEEEEQGEELEEVEDFTHLLEDLERSAVVVQGEGHFAAAEEQEEVQEEVQSARTPVTKRRPRLQSQGTPAGGLMVDLGLTGTVTRYTTLHLTTLHYTTLH